MHRLNTIMILFFAGLIAAATPIKAQADSIGITPMLRYITVDGDEDRFRENTWRDQGWAGGIEDFSADYTLDKNTDVKAKAHALFDEQDFGFRLDVSREETGWVRVGYSEYRTYDDDTGGFFRLFSPQAFDLNRDLELDIGNLFFEVGLSLPRWPQLSAGYEHRFKDGEKSLLHWGGVTHGEIARKIYPAYAEIDETVDIWRAEISHTLGGVRLEDRLQYERYSSDTIRHEQELDLTEGTSEQVMVFQEANNDVLFNTFFAENHFSHGIYVSFGYLYSEMDGDATFGMATVPFGPEPFDKNWSAAPIDLERDGHLINLNAMAGPYRDVTFYGGVEGELTDREGDADAVLYEITFSGEEEAPEARIRTRQDLDGIRESVGVRYAGISKTTLYAEGEFLQQQIDLNEWEIEDGELGFARITDTDVTRQRYTIGVNSSPISKTTFTALYRKSRRDNDYDHDLDTVADGYSAFITAQEFDMDEITVRVAAKPLGWFKCVLEYTRLASTIDTRTDADPTAQITSGDYQADIYTVSVLLTPVPRLYLSSLLSWRDIRATAYDNGAASVIPYDGDSLTSINSLNFIINDQTDVRMEYSLSRTGNFKDNSAQGLPLLADDLLQRFTAELTRKIGEGTKAGLQYGYFSYKPDHRGGWNDYSAHLIGMNLTFAL